MDKYDLRKMKGLRENPFHEELLDEFKVTKKREYLSGDKGVQQLIVNNEDQIIGESRFFRIKKYDNEKFTKIFTARMTNMWDMIPSATRVYSYILTNLPKESTEMYLFIEDVKKFTRYKAENSVWRGINWLITNNFIAKSYKPGFYWLNPTLFFNGDRVAFVEMIVKDPTIQNTKQKNILPPNGEL